jgi:hypothetical protein
MQPEPRKAWTARQLEAGLNELGHMGGQIQLLQLPLGEAVVEGDAQGLGGLGRVLGDVAGDLLGAQLLVVAGLGDVADVELLASASEQGHTWVIQVRAGHGHGGGGLADGLTRSTGSTTTCWSTPMSTAPQPPTHRCYT